MESLCIWLLDFSCITLSTSQLLCQTVLFIWEWLKQFTLRYIFFNNFPSIIFDPVIDFSNLILTTKFWAKSLLSLVSNRYICNEYLTWFYFLQLLTLLTFYFSIIHIIFPIQPFFLSPTVYLKIVSLTSFSTQFTQLISHPYTVLTTYADHTSLLSVNNDPSGASQTLQSHSS